MFRLSAAGRLAPVASGYSNQAYSFGYISPV